MKENGVFLSVMVLLVVLLGPVTLNASDFSSSDGAWTNASLWSAGLPAASDYAVINMSGGITCTIDSGDDAVARAIRIAYATDEAGTLIIDGGRLDLTSTDSFIGSGGNVTGSVSLVNGGILNGAGSALRFGRLDNSFGLLDISNGKLTNAVLQLGFQPATVTSGELRLSSSGFYEPSGEWYVGYHSVSTGLVNQAGGTINGNGKALNIGHRGIGTYNLSSGSVTNVSTLYVGNASNSVGRLNLGGDAILKKSGGATTIGVDLGSTGIINMSGGSFVVTNNAGNADLIIGDEGDGTLMVSAGSLSVVRNIILGNAFTGAGMFEINGGSIVCKDIVMSSTNSSRASLRIVGSGSTISLSDDLRTTVGSTNTYHFAPDAGGLSPVQVTDDIALSGTLEVDFSNMDPNTSELVLMTYGGALSTTFSATHILTPDWYADVDYGAGSNDQIKLMNIRYRPAGMIMFVR